MESVNWQIVTMLASVAALFWKIGRMQADNKAAHEGIAKRIDETNKATRERITETNEATKERITETNKATQTRIGDVYGLLQALLKQERKG